MRLLSTSIFVGAGIAALLLIGDAVVNEGRLLDSITGRRPLRAACLPELRQGLVERGYAPDDIEFTTRAPMSLDWGGTRTFASKFNFQDGPDHMRVDGVMSCLVGRTDVQVRFQTETQPVRAS